jgi:hypothetical protein
VVSNAPTSTTVQSQMDSFINTYCSANPNSGDCQCATGASNPATAKVYEAMQQGMDSVASCWYSPCATSTQLRPSNTQASLYKNSPCPSSICSDIVQILDSQGISNSKIFQNTTCTAGPPGPPSPTSGIPPWVWWTIGGSIGSLLLIILVFVLIKRSTRKSQT